MASRKMLRGNVHGRYAALRARRYVVDGDGISCDANRMKTNDGRAVEIIDRLDDCADYHDTFLVREVKQRRYVGWPFQASVLWDCDGEVTVYPLDVLVGME